MDHSTDAQSLVSQLEQLAYDNSRDLLPSPRQLYVIGGILFRMRAEDVSDLFFAYQHLVDSLPDFHWEYILTTFRQATSQLTDLKDCAEATESWCGLLTNAPRLCQMAYSKEWISTLSAIYDRFVLKDATKSQKYVLLATLSSLLLDGLLLQRDAHAIDEQILEAIQAMEENSTECLADLQSWQSQKEPFHRTLESEIRKLHTNSPDDENVQQREYILNMLESSRQKETVTSNVVAKNNKPATPSATASKPVSAADELERRIQQVKQILPDFGEGFIETALSLYQGNVETTVSTLLNDDTSTYPMALRVLDRSLPRRRKERADEEAAQADEARRLVKERVAFEEKQKEAQYKALMYVQAQEQQQQQHAQAAVRDEYDDDYDDQYDEIDVKLGGADDGMYDFEQVKMYNQLVRKEEAEDSFWQENQNTNRIQKNNKNNKKGDKANSEEENSGKQYRGPDKIKGGRVIGPDGKVVRKPGATAAKKTQGNTATSDQSGGLQPTDGTNNSKTTAPGKQTNNGSAQQSNQGKPRTKPKSQNRVDRQRDRKQKAQGTFGAPS